MQMFRTLCCAAVLGATMLSGAQAGTLVTPHFTITPTDTRPDYNYAFEVLSDAGGVTRIAVPISAEAFSIHADAWATTYDTVTLYPHGLMTPAAGYKVTGIAFSATVVGTYQPGDYDSSVFNGGLWTMSICPDTSMCWGGEIASVGAFGNLNGTQQMSGGVWADRDQPFFFYSDLWMDVQATHPWDGGPRGYASARLQDVVMTVFTSPVPEPQAWALLLTGLPLLGAIARRRRVTPG